MEGKILAGHLLKALADLLQLRVTSWHRSSSENAAAQGAPKSLHLIGAAVDVGREAAPEKLDLLRKLGFTVEWHTKGTAPHWHIYGDWPAIVLVAGSAGALALLIRKAMKR